MNRRRDYSMSDDEAIRIISKNKDHDGNPTLEANLIHDITDSSFIFYDFETRLNEKMSMCLICVLRIK